MTTSVHRTPASAKCCYVVSILGFIGSLTLLGMMVLKLDEYASDENCFLVAGGILGAVFWWAIGNVVAFLGRIAART